MNESELCAEIENEYKVVDSYIEAILRICEKHDLDIEFVAKHLSMPIIEKIRQEGIKLQYLPEISTLPFQIP